MKIFLCCSKHHYVHIPPIKEQLEQMWHTITLPNSYENPGREEEMKTVGSSQHAEWKGSMLRLQIQKVQDNDAILVCNFAKNGQENYIGWATFLEVFKARELGKKIFFYHPIPTGMLHDELCAMMPIVIDADVAKIL